ncbi:MAG: transposase [Gammaproteobacteria bacterium]|nr:transposase [Gammaproteobacteria bacterium]
MAKYIRVYQNGGCYFFTVVTWRRIRLFSSSTHVAILRRVIKQVKQQYPFEIDAMVVLPDHLHCLWRMPMHDDDYSTRWRLIKRYFSQQIDTPVNPRGEKQVWQRRFWEHLIRDESDWQNHMNYIHYNPVKHGLVDSPVQWPYSSLHRAIRAGFHESEWGQVEPDSVKGMALE